MPRSAADPWQGYSKGRGASAGRAAGGRPPASAPAASAQKGSLLLHGRKKSSCEVYCFCQRVKHKWKQCGRGSHGNCACGQQPGSEGSGVRLNKTLSGSRVSGFGRRGRARAVRRQTRKRRSADPGWRRRRPGTPGSRFSHSSDVTCGQG